MRKVPLGENVNAELIARGTRVSQVLICNLVNEAALFCCINKKTVDMQEFELAKR